MKLKSFLFVFVFALVSCNNDGVEYEIITVATPEIMSKAEFRSSVEVLGPQNIDEAGKIYAYNDYIFVNDQFKGVHIIDNTNPESPQAIAYIKIPGNVDISIKNNYLYADSSVDLVVFDISNINGIEPVERLEDVFSFYDYQLPEGIQEVNWNDFDFNSQVIVGWNVTQERREIVNINDDALFDGGGGIATGGAETGTGGSLARFQIVDDYLYTVGIYEMAIFNISNLEQPVLANTQYSGWNIETMFQADGYLYLGATNGMYIYSLDNPSSPEFISEFTHWEGCDPVVVDGDYAYLTLRGGNLCGQEESVLEVIDISNKYSPELVASYGLDNPYGLGFKDNFLFVCDGTSGLKVFDKTDPLEVTMLTQYPDIFTKDVIPLENVLLMIGDEILYQYEYTENGVNHISTFQL
ncbi:MAG: hypothetical protein HKO81_08225 [Flavobacteriaceae bacterium]|nr:hypothetical protein [Flavobacteriaceae bacterium]